MLKIFFALRNSSIDIFRKRPMCSFLQCKGDNQVAMDMTLTPSLPTFLTSNLSSSYKAKIFFLQI